MNKWELFQKFLVTQQEQIQAPDFIINAILIILLAWLIELTYRKCGKSLSNRKSFAANFILVGFTTMLIISVVKSSLALSLGLVGALSIVRFRAAIKEPEELAYLFLVISLGLGLGANLRLITLIAFGIFIIVIWGRYFLGRKPEINNMFLTVSADEKNINLGQIEKIISENFKRFQIKRFDETPGKIEAVYLIESKNIEALQNCKNQILQLTQNVRISFVDNKII